MGGEVSFKREEMRRWEHHHASAPQAEQREPQHSSFFVLKLCNFAVVI